MMTGENEILNKRLTHWYSSGTMTSCRMPISGAVRNFLKKLSDKQQASSVKRQARQIT
jgi:hypothetical protein